MPISESASAGLESRIPGEKAVRLLQAAGLSHEAAGEHTVSSETRLQVTDVPSFCFVPGAAGCCVPCRTCSAHAGLFQLFPASPSADFFILENPHLELFSDVALKSSTEK